MSDSNRKLIQLNIISAVDLNMGIGRGQVLPWHIPSEFRYFLDMTSHSRRTGDGGRGMRNAVVVGRKTWDTMDSVTSKPHPGALNIVLSRALAGPLGYPDTIVCPSMDHAVEVLATDPVHGDIDQVWVLGGAEVYRSALASPNFHRLYLTRIKQVYPCDSFFPREFDEQSYQRVPDDEICDSRVPIGEQVDKQSGVRYEVCVYERKTR